MAHSLHSILTDVFDRTNSAIRAIFESGGGSTAWSTHTVVRAVYDQANSAIRISDITPVGHFGAYLEDDLAVSDEWTDIPVKSATKTNFTHVDGEADIVIDNAGTYMIAVSLI